MPRSQHYKRLWTLVFTCFPKIAWESRVIVNVCRTWSLFSDNDMLCDWDRAVCQSGAYWGKKLLIILRLLNEWGWSSLWWTWVLYQTFALNLVPWWLQLAATCFPEVSMTPCRASHLHFFFFLSVDSQNSLLVLQQILAIVYFPFSHPGIDLSVAATCRYPTQIREAFRFNHP